jgi:hypothetical protein
MKSKATFHWLDSNRIRLAIRQNEQPQSYLKLKNHFSLARFQSNYTSNSPKNEQIRSYHEIESHFSLAQLQSNWTINLPKRTNLKLSRYQNPLFIRLIPIELVQLFSKDEQTQSSHEIKNHISLVPFQSN